MAKSQTAKTTREPFFHVVKRDDLPWQKAWLIRVVTILISFVLVGVFCAVVTGKGFGESFEIMFTGVFGRIFEGRFTMLWKSQKQNRMFISIF